MASRVVLLTFLAAGFLVTVSQAQKKKLQVQIVNRQANQSEYTYSVPGYSQTNCSVYVTGTYGNGSCVQTTAPATAGTYVVRGATLSLLLPDGQLVVVNCDAKANWTDWHQGTWRSCRQPITDSVYAEFNGDKAKLEWSVSIDGKKKQNETFKIIGILAKIPTSETPKPPQ